MPLESKYALRVSSIPDGATNEQYADFVRSVSMARPEGCEKKSMFSSFKAKHWKKISKRNIGALVEPSQAASPSTSGQDDTPLIRGIDDGIRTTFASQHGLKIGTIAFSSKKTSELVLEGHEKARKNTGYPWKDWDLSSNFQGVTVLYEHEEAEEENEEGRRAKTVEGSQRSKKTKMDME